MILSSKCSNQANDLGKQMILKLTQAPTQKNESRKKTQKDAK